jgi:hypothetical protein
MILFDAITCDYFSINGCFRSIFSHGNNMFSFFPNIDFYHTIVFVFVCVIVSTHRCTAQGGGLATTTWATACYGPSNLMDVDLRSK